MLMVKTGEVSQTFTPLADAPVTKVVAASDGTSVLGGGRFDTIDGVGPYMGPEFAGPREPGQALQALDIDTTTSGDRLVVAGNFTTIDGLSRYQIGLLDLTGATATVVDWALTGPNATYLNQLRAGSRNDCLGHPAGGFGASPRAA